MRHPSSNALQEDIPEKELFPESEELTPDNDSYGEEIIVSLEFKPLF